MNYKHNNHIFITPNCDYEHAMLQMCDRAIQLDKKVLLISQRPTDLSLLLEKPFSLRQLEHFSILQIINVETAPKNILAIYKCVPQPDLLIFDLKSIFVELLRWPVTPQRTIDSLVRIIAKCSAAFCNYNEMVRNFKKQIALNNVSQGVLDTIIIMPEETAPLTPAQFNLLIGLYFFDNECHHNFDSLAKRIFESQGLNSVEEQ